jgi:predicted enzyme related to lactoylglutathione lyase
MVPLLQVFDMPTSVGFYQALFGFEIRQTSPVSPDGHFDWVFLSHPNMDLMLNTAFERHTRPTTQDPALYASHADTSLYIGCADMHAAVTAIRAQGVVCPAPLPGADGVLELPFFDPDGYRICLRHTPLPEQI